MTNTCDALVIGAGQAGPPLVEQLTAAGMSVAFDLTQALGCTCVNTGCIPSKTLVNQVMDMKKYIGAAFLKIEDVK